MPPQAHLGEPPPTEPTPTEPTPAEATLSRRTFLLASAGAAAALAAAACGSGKGSGSEITVNKSDTNSSNPPKDVSLVVASYIHVAGMDQRVTVALINPDQGPYQAKGPVRISIDDQPVDAVLHTEGISLPYFLIHHTFASAGVHDIEAAFDGKKLTTPIEIVEPGKSQVPVEGKPLIRTPTPTPAANQGVNPICTRQPVCPFHDVSLDAALDQKRPIALIFATPALCQSRLCGPVLENLIAVKDEFAAKVTMIHSEIYTDLQGKTLTPAVQAYHLESEPFLFLADANGVVKARLDNAYDKVEVKDALTRLVNG